MLRAEIETYMRENGLKNINLVYNEDDDLAVYCFLQGGYLVDYSGHRVDRKKNIWGYMKIENGEITRYPFENWLN